MSKRFLNVVLGILCIASLGACSNLGDEAASEEVLSFESFAVSSSSTVRSWCNGNVLTNSKGETTNCAADGRRCCPTPTGGTYGGGTNGGAGCFIPRGGSCGQTNETPPKEVPWCEGDTVVRFGGSSRVSCAGNEACCAGSQGVTGCYKKVGGSCDAAGPHNN